MSGARKSLESVFEEASRDAGYPVAVLISAPAPPEDLAVDVAERARDWQTDPDAGVPVPPSELARRLLRHALHADVDGTDVPMQTAAGAYVACLALASALSTLAVQIVGHNTDAGAESASVLRALLLLPVGCAELGRQAELRRRAARN